MLTLTPAAQPTTEEMVAQGKQMADAIENGTQPDDGKEAFSCRLPPRFADYLRDRAAAHGDTPENHLATILRQFWKDDAWRQTDGRPQVMGEAAGSGRR